jgi:hypothetical protein
MLKVWSLGANMLAAEMPPGTCGSEHGETAHVDEISKDTGAQCSVKRLVLGLVFSGCKEESPYKPDPCSF